MERVEPMAFGLAAAIPTTRLSPPADKAVMLGGGSRNAVVYMVWTPEPSLE
jgi:hypothetical protein